MNIDWGLTHVTMFKWGYGMKNIRGFIGIWFYE